MADYDYRNSEIYKKAVERYNVIQEAKKTATQTNAYSPEKIIPLQKAIEKKVTEEREKNIQQQQDKGREETLKRAPEITAAEKQKAEKALSDFDEKGEYDWTDQNSRKQYEAERKNLQAAVEKSGAELAQRERDLYAREHPGSAPYSMEMERNLNFANNNWDSTYYDPYDGGAYHARKEKEKAEREAAKAAKAESSVPETQSSIDEVRKQYQESLSALEDYKKSTPIPVTGGFGIDQGQPDANSEQYRKTVELESRANNLKRQLESMEAQEITDKNMAEIEKMTPEARKHLEALTNLNSASKYYGTYSGGQVNTDFVQEEARRQQEARQALIDMGYSVDKISKLAASLSRYNNARDAENMKKETEELADSGFWGSVAGNAISLATNVAAGPAGTLEALGSMIAPDSEYKTADPNMPGYATGMFTEGIRGATSENIREMPGGAALDIGYKGLMGALDNVARLYAGGGGKVGSLLLSSTGAFQNTFRESVQKGDPTWKAALSGVVDAGIEEFTEKYSLDNLLDDPVPITSLKQMVKTALKQGAVEASEEEVGLVLNVFADLLINGDRSEMVTSIQDMVANGESYEEAQREYIKGKAHEAMDTALTSMVSGAGMSVGRNILIGNTPGKNAKMANAEQTTDAAPGTPDNADFHVTPDGDAIPVNNNQQTQETPGPATDSPQSASTNPGTVADTAESVMRGENTAPAKSGETAIWEAANAIANGTFTEKMLTPVLENPDAMALLHDRYGLTLDGADPQNRNAVWQLLGDIAYGKAERKDFTASWTDGLKDQTPPPPPKTPVQEQLDRAAQATFDGAPVDDAHASGEGTAVNTSPAAEAQRKTEAAKMTMRKALNGRITPDVLSEITNNDQILRFLNEYCGLELYNGRKMNDIRADVRSIFDYAKQNGARNNLERSLSVFLDDEFGSEYYSVEYQNAQPSSRETPVNASLAQNQPTANGQPVANPAVGAADANFTGRAAYADLLSDENSQPDRPTDVRPMEVPRRNADGRRVTEFAADAYAAPVTPDHMANAIESLIQDGELSFDTRTNKESLENARKVIKKDGEEETIRRISDNARAGRIQDGDIEQGLILYAQYANDPKLQDKASSMLVDLGKIANMSGRNLQMFALLRRMTPEGQMMAVEKNISRYADGINKRRGRRNQFTDTDINPDLKRAFMSATNDEERQSAADAIYMDVAAKIKPTLGEQWDAWRNLSMLGNPITHMRNVGATGAFQPFVHVKRNIAGALQALTMKKEQRTESMFGLGIGKKGRDLLSFAWEDSKTQEAKGLMGLTSTTGDEARTAIDENRKVLPGALDKVAKFNMDAMEAEDFVFKREEYAYSLASFLKARGYDADQVKSGQIPNGVMMEARQHAAGAAMKATFNDNNAFSDWMVSTLRPKYGGSVDPFLNVVKKGLLPYIRTPANLVVRSVEYNPFGAAALMVNDARTGNFNAETAIDRISTGLTGTAAMALGAALAHGLVPGMKLHGSVTEEEKELGIKPYSVEVDGKCYSIAWVAPGSIPMFIGANMYNNCTKAKEDKPEGLNGWDYTWEAIKAASGYIEPMLELSMLSSFDDALKAYSSAENPVEGLLAGFLTAATNYLTQGFPTVFGQWEKATEEYKNTTYINTANPFERTIKQALSSASQRIPGIDLYQTAAIDKWGQSVKNGNSALERAINATINPTNISEISSDPVDLEIDRLSKAQKDDVTAPYFRKVISYTDKNGVDHDNVRLTAEQWDQLARKEGTTRHDLIAQMMESKDYQAMTDEQKAKSIDLVYAYAKETAELDLFKDHEGYSASWMTDASNRKASAYILNRVLNSDIGHAMTELTTGWKNGHTKAVTDRWAGELETAYDSYSKMTLAAKKEVRDFATGDAARYIEARDNGVSHTDAMIAMRTIASLRPETDYKEVRDIQKYEAISKMPTLSDKEKDVFILDYMGDYDPTDKSPETTELKYQYARQEMGLTPEQYIKALKANTGKAGERKAAWREIGFTDKEVNILYRLLGGNVKGKINTVDWYNRK